MNKDLDEAVDTFHKFTPMLMGASHLRLLALLRPYEWCPFGLARETLGIGEAAMKRDLVALRDIDLIETRFGTGRVSLLRLTRAGQYGLAVHVAALTELATPALEDLWVEFDADGMIIPATNQGEQQAASPDRRHRLPVL